MKNRIIPLLVLLCTVMVWSNVASMEYFWDTVVDTGNGTALVGVNSMSTALEVALANDAAVPADPGMHILYVRSCSDSGLWSAPKAFPIYVDSMEATTYAGQMQIMEYFWDTPVTPGSGNLFAGDENSWLTALEHAVNSSATVPATHGAHTLYVRSKGTNGLWGEVRAFPIFVDSIAQSTYAGQLQIMEYYWDTPVTPGSGNLFAGDENSWLTALEHAVNIGATVPATHGAHALYVRSKGGDGVWGPSRAFPIFIDTMDQTTYAGQLSTMEYYWDTPVEPGAGTLFVVAGNNWNTPLEAAINSDSETPATHGAHTLYVRAKGGNGIWGAARAFPIFIDTTLSGDNGFEVVAMEYFVNDDPGEGQGIDITQIVKSGAFVGDALIDIEGRDLGASGAIKVGIRVKDHSNTWGDAKWYPIFVDESAPLLTKADSMTIAEDSFLVVTPAMTDAVDDDDDPLSIVFEAVPDGANYTISGDTIIPNANFHGEITVPLRVTDGNSVSDSADMVITVTAVNDAPTLSRATAQTIAEDGEITLTLAMTDASDVDGDLLTLLVSAGDNYTLDGTNVIPAPEFSGVLTVPVAVKDAEFTTDTVHMIITVTEVNDAPTVSKIDAQEIPEDTVLTVTVAMTDAQDIDSDILSVVIGSGTNYTVEGTVVKPKANFNGTLSVPVYIKDEETTVGPVDLSIVVTPVNDAPTLTAATAQQVREDSLITLDLSMTNAFDVDGDPLTMLVGAGDNYTVDGLVVTPAKDFFGILTVPVSVKDAEFKTGSVDMSITVLRENDAPVLTTVTSQVIPEDSLLTVTLDMTDAFDADGDALTLIVGDGANYTVEGTVVKPVANFNGILTVPVSVKDAEFTSSVVNMTITVTPVNDAPVLTAAVDQVTKQEAPITLDLGMTNATDVDGDALSLLIGTGENYVVEGTTVTPIDGFVGELAVPLSVSDGVLNSNSVNMTITVKPTVAIKESVDVATGLGVFSVAPSIITTEAEAHFVIHEELSGEGKIAVLDHLGDLIDEQEISVINGGHFYWDLKNRNGVSVSSGVYLVVLELSGKLYKQKIGIKR